MKRTEFLEKIKSYDIKRYLSNYKLAEQKRQQFIKKFTPSYIRQMDIDEYVQGKGKKNENFCYGLEWELEAMGRITGATAHKFGIFYSKSGKNYVVTKAWDKGSIEASFKLLANSLADLIENAKNGDIEEIRKSPFSKMVKGKILSVYMPEKHLNIFSEKHIDYFIHRLDLDNKVNSEDDVIQKRFVLADFKASFPEMNKWPLHAFGHFLYTEYPGYPRDSDEKIEYIKNIKLINLKFESLSSLPSGKGHGKGDYESQHKRNKDLGERGEYIVMQKEKELLKKFNVKKAPIQISATDDSVGYDIISCNEDGSKKYIEVKATNSSPKDFTFYFTANELKAAKMHGKDYHLYVVFHPYSSHPIIADLGNPASEEVKIHMIPVTYKLHIKETN